MPSVRYYDYGVLRMESDKRMLEAQRSSARQSMPMRRVNPGWSKQTRPAEESLPIRPPDAHDCENSDGADVCRQNCECAAVKTNNECAEPENDGTQRLLNLSGEELLIAALLILAISEGSELPLILALLYLLM